MSFQKRFIHGYDKLYYSKRDDEGKFGPVEPRNPVKIFSKRNHNTRYDNGQPTDIVERKIFGSIDDQLCKLVDEIRPLVQRRESFDISKNTDFTLRIIFIEMMRRVPEAQKDFPQNYYAQLEITAEKLAKQYPEKEREIRNAVEKKYDDPLELKNVELETRTKYPERILLGMEGMTFRFALLPEKAMFILSSNMIQRLSNGGTGSLDDPRTELWFPIDPKIAIVVGRFGPHVPQFFEFNRSFAKEYNDLAVRRSYEIASPNQKLLTALARRRMT